MTQAMRHSWVFPADYRIPVYCRNCGNAAGLGGGREVSCGNADVDCPKRVYDASDHDVICVAFGGERCRPPEPGRTVYYRFF